MILCDIGNTTFHFLLKYLNTEKEVKISIKESIDDIESFYKYENDVYFISVNEKATKKFRDRFPKSINLKDKIILKTDYSKNLGIDRIVACKTISNGIIVDFGSAITVDIMQNNRHLGGFIMPGFEAIKSSYIKISNQLSFEFNEDIDYTKLPANTNEAISFAIINMIVLPIKKMQRTYGHKLIITGETSKFFLGQFDNYEFRSRLIFDSMQDIIVDLKNQKALFK